MYYTAENANVFKLPCPLRVHMQAAPSVLLRDMAVFNHDVSVYRLQYKHYTISDKRLRHGGSGYDDYVSRVPRLTLLHHVPVYCHQLTLVLQAGKRKGI